MLTTIEGLLERERGSKCDGFAVTFTTIDVPAAYANVDVYISAKPICKLRLKSVPATFANGVGKCGWQRGRCAREQMARE